MATRAENKDITTIQVHRDFIAKIKRLQKLRGIVEDRDFTQIEVMEGALLYSLGKAERELKRKVEND